MKKLSVGCDSTLKNWRDLAAVTWGEDSAAVKLLDDRIAEEGENAEVIADEGQFIHLLHSTDKQSRKAA